MVWAGDSFCGGSWLFWQAFWWLWRVQLSMRDTKITLMDLLCLSATKLKSFTLDSRYWLFQKIRNWAEMLSPLSSSRVSSSVFFWFLSFVERKGEKMYEFLINVGMVQPKYEQSTENLFHSFTWKLILYSENNIRPSSGPSQSLKLRRKQCSVALILSD